MVTVVIAMPLSSKLSLQAWHVLEEGRMIQKLVLWS